MKVYYYFRNQKKNYLYYDENHEHCHPIYINKEHTYQDIFLEEAAMNLLSPEAFVAYCYLSIKATGVVWIVGLKDLPLSEPDALKAMNELIAKGYLEKCTLNAYDDNDEAVQLPAFCFNERLVTPITPIIEKQNEENNEND